MSDPMLKYRCKTKLGNWAVVSMHKWTRGDFAYLGLIEQPGGIDRPPHVIPWAWHEDGRSIDREDRGFDLVDFPAAEELAA